jgi:hypothetical protein
MLAGCNGANPSQADIEQMVNDILVANAEVNTCAFDMDMTATIEIAGGNNPVKTNMSGSGKGLVDSGNRKMFLSLDTTADVPDEGSQTVNMETYMVNEWVYIKIASPLMDSNWMKMRMPEEMWESSNQLEQQRQMFEDAQEVNFAGTKNLDGVACYVVEITPDAETTEAMLSQIQMPEIPDVDFSQINFADMIKQMSYKVWVAKDDYLFRKVEYHMIIEMLPENFGATAEDFSKITEDIATGIVFYDYNKPVSIEVPAEALEAPDFPGQLTQ